MRHEFSSVKSTSYLCASLKFVCKAPVSLSLRSTGKHLERKLALNMNLWFYKFCFVFFPKQDAPGLSTVFIQIFGVTFFWISSVRELEHCSARCTSLRQKCQKRKRKKESSVRLKLEKISSRPDVHKVLHVCFCVCERACV